MDNYSTHGSETKICTVCGEAKKANNLTFSRQKTGRLGLKSMCKVCQKSKDSTFYKKGYYEENKETINKKNSEHYFRNKENIMRQRRNKRSLTTKQEKQKSSDKSKIYYIENKERLKSYAREYRQTCKGKEVGRQSNQRRRHLERSTPTNFTLDDWEKCITHFNGRCCYCEGKEDTLHQEHFIPLSKGGEYTKQNILPSCRTCNFKKHNIDFKEWYNDYEHYSLDRKIKILSYLGYENKEQQLELL